MPFVFVYSPSLLLVAQGFNFYDFFVTLISAMIGIGLIGVLDLQAIYLKKFLHLKDGIWELFHYYLLHLV